MADEVLVKEPFTTQMIDAGNSLLERVREGNFPMAAAFWLYEMDNNRWKFTLATPLVDEKGPLAAYGTLLDWLYGPAGGTSAQREWVDIEDMTLVGLDDPNVKALAKLSRGSDLSARRVRGSYIEGTWIEDAYIYFLDKSLARARKNGA